MTQYKKEFPFPVMFPPFTPKNVLAEWLSVHNVPQFHTAGRYLTRINPLIPLNNQDRISLYNVSIVPSRQVMRLKKNISWIISRSNCKFSKLTL